MAAKSKTFVFVLDLDGTVVGDITLAIEHRNLCDFVNQLVDAGALPSSCRSSVDLRPAFDKQGLLRPGFVEFVETMRKTHDGVEFFVYTCGTRHWAEKIVSEIERCHPSVRFNRPLMVREESCINHSRSDPYKQLKSLKMVMPTIREALRAKNGKACEITEQNVLFIDDLPGNLLEGSERLLKCPAYRNIVNFDIAHTLSETAKKSEQVKAFVRSAYLRFFMKQEFFLEVDRAPCKDACAGAFKVRVERDDVSAKDDFWRVLCQALLAKRIGIAKTNTRLTDPQVSALQDRVDAGIRT